MTLNMIENIRRIGIFMIAAQTVMHFAPGKKYEKYMKIIAGVIVLLLFVSPFVSSSGDVTAKWQAGAEQMMKMAEGQNDVWQGVADSVSPVETVVLKRIEEEVKTRLNDVIPDDNYSVSDVRIDLEETGGDYAGTTEGDREWSFRRVRVTLQSRRADGFSNEYEDINIRIEEITVGHEAEENPEQYDEEDSNQEAGTQEYRSLFAQTLGIAEDRVEVTYRGGT